MYPMTFLEWLHPRGEWCRIGWDATTPESARRLREHGEALSQRGGEYRLTRLSHLRDQPDEVIHVYPVKEADHA